MSHGPSMSPKEALERLMKGNSRFAEGKMTHYTRLTQERRQELTKGQSPFATVLTCADSRVSAEHIFDAGLGEIFICRNAGNMVDELTLGSIEYAAAHTGCPMVLVLGHTKCGAVGATIASAKNPDMHETPNVDDIVRRLLPAVIASRQDNLDDASWVEASAKKNVLNVRNHILQRSPLLAEKSKRGEYLVVGGIYDLSTGRVELLAG